jgi:GYD domain
MVTTATTITSRPSGMLCDREKVMPIFISQGRYSQEAMRGMVKTPEDRTEAVSKLIEAAGGKLLALYVTFGEYDWLLIVPGSRICLGGCNCCSGRGRCNRH